MAKEFYVVIEKDEDGFFIGEVPTLKGCYSQGKTIDELLGNMREVIEMALEDEPYVSSEFIGVQKVSLEDEPTSS
jgi:predicted RNase H-like HicB family nuclease